MYPLATLDHHWPPPMKNRRAAQRFARRFPTRYTQKNQQIESMAMDISSTGIRVEMNHEVNVGTVVEMTLQPSPNATLAVKATAMWSAPSWKEGQFEAGFAFAERSSGELSALQNWLRT